MRESVLRVGAHSPGSVEEASEFERIFVVDAKSERQIAELEVCVIDDLETELHISVTTIGAERDRLPVTFQHRVRERPVHVYPPEPIASRRADL